MRGKGYQTVPDSGEDVACSITVPGTVAGWEVLLRKHGRMKLKQVLQPAMMYAADGFPVSEIAAMQWQEHEAKLQQSKAGHELLLDGRAPRCGEVMRLPTLATMLQALREGGRGVFYEGGIARKIAEYVQAEGGWLTWEDLLAHGATWEEPISTDYRGVTVWECPPNSQGLATLLALNTARHFDLPSVDPQSLPRYHWLIEAMRLGYADALRYVADPKMQDVPVEALLAADYAYQRSQLIRDDLAMADGRFGTPSPLGNTVYVTVVDAEGNACSLMNSLFQGFGSGLVVPGTGIALHNRGACFSLDPAHPNCLAAGKRPYHTIMPALATRNEELLASFGVMGAYQQPQGQLQLLSNLVDYGMNAQHALDALRFSVDLVSQVVRLESGVDAEVLAGLQARQHSVQVLEGFARREFGGGQVIVRDLESGVLCGGTEPRQDGGCVGF